MSIYKQANDAEHERLRRFVSTCSDADLQQAMPDGWTVGAVLAHLAFWDQRSTLLLDRWIREGLTPPPDDERNIDWINDATKPLFLMVPPRDAAELALLSAEAADSAVERVLAPLVERNTPLGTPVNLRRSW